MEIRDILVLTLLIGSLPLCFFRPFFGIAMWTIIAFMNPHRLAWGAARDFPAAEAVAIPTILGILAFTRDWRSFFGREAGFLVMLWGWFTLTTIYSTSTALFMHHAADTWLRWQYVSKVLLMTVLTIGVVNSWDRLRLFVLTIAASFGFLVAKLVPWLIITQGAERVYGPQGTMVADNNDFGLALNMTIPLFFFLGKAETDQRVKWAMRFLFLATIPAIIFTYSRGALLGFSVVAVLMLLRSRQRMMLIPILALVAVFGALFTPQAWRDRMAFFQNGDLDSSALGRINAWGFAFHLASDYPITGGGFETFTPELFQIYAKNPQDVHGPHSIYFEVLGDQGFVGAFLYALLTGGCFWRLAKIRKYARRLGDERAAMYASMFQLSLIAFMVSGAFLGRAYFDYFLTIVACTVILKQVCLKEWSAMSTDVALEDQEQVA